MEQLEPLCHGGDRIGLAVEIIFTLKKLEKDLVTAFNKGIKKSQEIAATNMKDILSQMGGGFPGFGDQK